MLETAICQQNYYAEMPSNNHLEYAEENWIEGCFNDVRIQLKNEEIEESGMVWSSRSLYCYSKQK